MTERISLSCCYMVRNEEEFLEASLESTAPHFSEVLIADTGSTDSTSQIIRRLQVKYPWIRTSQIEWHDHFSEARNAVAALAQNDWVLFLDGDEVLDPKAVPMIEAAILNTSIACYSIIQRNYIFDPRWEGAQRALEKVPGWGADSTLYFFDNWMERLYRPKAGATYEGRIHESLLPSCRRLHLAFEKIEVILHHFGRLKKNIQAKPHYYLSLCEKKIQEEPDNAAAWIEFIVNLLEIRDTSKAFSISQTAVSRFSDEPEILKVGFQSALRADEFVRAEQWIRDYLKFKKDDSFALSQLTTALLYQKKFSEVIQISETLLSRTISEPDRFVTHINRGVLHFERGEHREALHHFKSAHQLRSDDAFSQSAIEKISAMLQKH